MKHLRAFTILNPFRPRPMGRRTNEPRPPEWHARRADTETRIRNGQSVIELTPRGVRRPDGHSYTAPRHPQDAA